MSQPANFRPTEKASEADLASTSEVSAVRDADAAAIDFVSPQLTIRAVGSGMLIGGVLSLCNIYSGLKIGWGFNMSITAALLAFGFWKGAERVAKTQPFGLLENNVNQTAASSAAAISSAGLVAPIPALTMLTGQTFTWPVLVLWTFSVCLVGITVAIGLRRQMIVVDKLPFASGIAAAETLKEMYAKGREAMIRVRMLIGGGIVAASLKIAETVFRIPKLALPGAVPAAAGGALAQKGIAGATLHNLTFALEPSLLMIGVGGLIGIRAGVSLILGAILSWGVIGPWALDRGYVQPGDPAASWYGPLLGWLLWPGVAMMVSASLASFAFSFRSIAASMRRGGAKGETGVDDGDVPRKWFWRALVVSLVFAVVLQFLFFDIAPHIGFAGVLLTFVLAVVAGRVSGETSITPVGAMGKVTQLVFGVIAPGQPAANLMAANVTGGAASQCADLLHDLKTGYLLKAVPRYQAVAQVGGAFAGALIGSAGYLILLPDPKNQLLTDEWPAPAVAAWKAVAEIFMRGLEAMPAGAMTAMGWAALAGVVLAVLEKVAPANVRKWIPSPASVGLAFVVPAYNAVSMFIGAVLALAVTKIAPNFATRFLVVIAAGLVAGESITGVAIAVQKILTGG